MRKLKSKNRFYLGVDAGGTKTVGVVADGRREIKGQGYGGRANYHNVGLIETERSLFQAIISAIIQAKEKTGQESLKIEAACLGIAGLDTEKDKRILSEMVNQGRLKKIIGKKVSLVNDGLVGLRSGVEENYGLSLVAGTGANCYGINKNGEEAFAGDWGYLLGDQGGGYDMGLKILRAVMAAFDGRGEKTVLTDLVLSHSKLSAVPDLVDWVYKEKGRFERIVSLPSLIDKAVVKGDTLAKKLIREQARELALAVWAVVKRLRMEKEKFPLVFIGSLFNPKETLLRKTEREILRVAPKAYFVLPDRQPAEGAVRLALEIKGV